VDAWWVGADGALALALGAGRCLAASGRLTLGDRADGDAWKRRASRAASFCALFGWYQGPRCFVGDRDRFHPQNRRWGRCRVELCWEDRVWGHPQNLSKILVGGGKWSSRRSGGSICWRGQDFTKLLEGLALVIGQVQVRRRSGSLCLQSRKDLLGTQQVHISVLKCVEDNFNT
jgi:hypothetical protein